MREIKVKILDSLLAKCGVYLGIIVSIVIILKWLGVEAPAGYAGFVLILIVMGALVIWIDHTFQKKKT